LLLITDSDDLWIDTCSTRELLQNDDHDDQEQNALQDEESDEATPFNEDHLHNDALHDDEILLLPWFLLAL
jgi:hypothetical protein